jgi:Tol biopolymer transport system component
VGWADVTEWLVVKRVGAFLAAICASLVLAAAAAQSASAAFPGGDGLIATDDSDGACTGSCADASGPGDQVSTVDPQTGAATAITSPDVNAQAFAPRWSASGQRLVFIQFGFPFDDLKLTVSDSTGANLQTISLPLSLESPGDPSFTADGMHVLFVGRRSTRRLAYDIYRVGLDRTGLTQITHLSARGALQTPTESSHGRIAFVRAGWIYLLDRTGHAKRLHRGIAPDFSPNGARIVFEDPNVHLLETIAVNGRGLRRVTRLPPVDTCSGGFLRAASARPVYAPSGKYIAFTRYGDCGSPPDKLIVIHADGTHARVVLRNDPVQDPAWQPLPAPAGAHVSLRSSR